jgi:type I restriction enzyme S subunit
MEEFKDSHVRRIPDAWEVTSIGEISNVVRGASPRPKGDPRYYGGTVPRLMGRDVSRDGKYVTPKIDFLTEEGAKLSRFMPKGTLVMICSGDVGVPSILNVDACVHDGFLAFPDISKDADINYLYYIFDSLHQKFNSSATHGGIFTNLTTSIIKDFKIPLPPLPEQQKIAEILSTVDDKIEVIDQQITETHELKKGLMQRLLTKGIGHTEFKDSPLGKIPESWEVVKLGTLLNNIKGGGTPSKDIPEYWKNEIPWVTVKDLKKSILDDSIDYISEMGLKNSATNLIPAWTLIISTRMAVGKAIFVTKDVSINQDLKALFPKDSLNKFFLFHWFFYNTENILKLASGSTVKGIRLEVLKGLEVALPSIQEQQKIAYILSSVDEKLELLTQKKVNYQELKKGLMQQLLTGKIRVKL